ncbi:MAG: hypothetical protein H7203_08110 [Rhizobacter sp.]|nr:hypothetical protein [Burkholderiales bacterium]
MDQSNTAQANSRDKKETAKDTKATPDTKGTGSGNQSNPSTTTDASHTKTSDGKDAGTKRTTLSKTHK